MLQHFIFLAFTNRVLDMITYANETIMTNFQ